MLRFLIRLTLLGLAAYGAKTLYDRYGARVRGVQEPARELAQRTAVIVDETVGRAREAAREGVGAVNDATEELGRAAEDAKDEATRQLSGAGEGTARQ